MNHLKCASTFELVSESVVMLNYMNYVFCNKVVEPKLAGVLGERVFLTCAVTQARLAQLDGEHRDDHLRRLASLNHHLHDLDKQVLIPVTVLHHACLLFLI